jgi:hypothetical protein
VTVCSSYEQLREGERPEYSGYAMWESGAASWDVLRAALTSEVMGMALLSKTQTGQSQEFTVKRTMGPRYSRQCIQWLSTQKGHAAPAREIPGV